jgi:hypothetical protein
VREIDRPDLDAMAARIVDQRTGRVKTHRLGIEQPAKELGREVALEICRGIDQ